MTDATSNGPGGSGDVCSPDLGDVDVGASVAESAAAEARSSSVAAAAESATGGPLPRLRSWIGERWSKIYSWGERVLPLVVASLYWRVSATAILLFDLHRRVERRYLESNGVAEPHMRLIVRAVSRQGLAALLAFFTPVFAVAFRLSDTALPFGLSVQGWTLILIIVGAADG